MIRDHRKCVFTEQYFEWKIVDVLREKKKKNTDTQETHTRAHYNSHQLKSMSYLLLTLSSIRLCVQSGMSQLLVNFRFLFIFEKKNDNYIARQ